MYKLLIKALPALVRVTSYIVPLVQHHLCTGAAASPTAVPEVAFWCKSDLDPFLYYFDAFACVRYGGLSRKIHIFISTANTFTYILSQEQSSPQWKSS